MRSNWAARTAAVFYAVWGLVHVLGAGMQLSRLGSAGGSGLAAMLASATPTDAASQAVSAPAAAFMGMGAFNLLWIGLLVTVIAVTLNWRNSELGFWLNMALVGLTDLGLLNYMLLSQIMAWSDGALGLVLFIVALGFSIAGRALQGAAAAVRLQGV